MKYYLHEADDGGCWYTVWNEEPFNLYISNSIGEVITSNGKHYLLPTTGCFSIRDAVELNHVLTEYEKVLFKVKYGDIPFLPNENVIKFYVRYSAHVLIY